MRREMIFVRCEIYRGCSFGVDISLQNGQDAGKFKNVDSNIIELDDDSDGADEFSKKGNHDGDLDILVKQPRRIGGTNPIRFKNAFKSLVPLTVLCQAPLTAIAKPLESRFTKPGTTKLYLTLNVIHPNRVFSAPKVTNIPPNPKFLPSTLQVLKQAETVRHGKLRKVLRGIALFTIHSLWSDLLFLIAWTMLLIGYFLTPFVSEGLMIMKVVCLFYVTLQVLGMNVGG